MTVERSSMRFGMQSERVCSGAIFLTICQSGTPRTGTLLDGGMMEHGKGFNRHFAQKPERRPVESLTPI